MQSAEKNAITRQLWTKRPKKTRLLPKTDVKKKTPDQTKRLSPKETLHLTIPLFQKETNNNHHHNLDNFYFTIIINIVCILPDYLPKPHPKLNKALYHTWY